MEGSDVPFALLGGTAAGVGRGEIVSPLEDTGGWAAAHCASNIRNLALAVGVYAEDNDGRLVPARTSAGAPAVRGTGWDVLLLPYHRSEQLYLCLSDQTPAWANATKGGAHP